MPCIRQRIKLDHNLDEPTSQSIDECANKKKIEHLGNVITLFGRKKAKENKMNIWEMSSFPSFSQLPNSKLPLGPALCRTMKHELETQKQGKRKIV